MATGRRTVAPGQVVASDWGNTVWDQSVQQFASSADRTTQFPAPKKGALSWLDDVLRLDVYDGTVWRPVLFGSVFTRTLAGSSVVTTNSSGGWSIGYGPFPSTPVVVAMDGDGSGTNINIIGITNSQVTTTTFGGVARIYSGPAVNSAAIRINWIAYG